MAYLRPSAPLPGQENPQAPLQFSLESRLSDLSHGQRLDLLWRPASRSESFKILLITISMALLHAQQKYIITSFLSHVAASIRHSSLVRHPWHQFKTNVETTLNNIWWQRVWYLFLFLHTRSLLFFIFSKHKIFITKKKRCTDVISKWVARNSKLNRIVRFTIVTSAQV